MWKAATCLGVILGSIIVYFMKFNSIIVGTTWTTECYGFVWGIILATIKNNFLDYHIRKWHLKWAISCIISMFLGVSYLLLKPVPFLGDYILKIMLGVAITAFVLIANVRINFGNKINLFLGGISFEIYLIHGFVFNLLRRLIVWHHSSVYILSCMLTTVIAAYLIGLIADKIVKVVIKTIIGNN